MGYRVEPDARCVDPYVRLDAAAAYRRRLLLLLERWHGGRSRHRRYGRYPEASSRLARTPAITCADTHTTRAGTLENTRRGEGADLRRRAPAHHRQLHDESGVHRLLRPAADHPGVGLARHGRL